MSGLSTEVKPVRERPFPQRIPEAFVGASISQLAACAARASQVDDSQIALLNILNINQKRNIGVMQAHDLYRINKLAGHRKEQDTSHGMITESMTVTNFLEYSLIPSLVPDKARKSLAVYKTSGARLFRSTVAGSRTI